MFIVFLFSTDSIYTHSLCVPVKIIQIGRMCECGDFIRIKRIIHIHSVSINFGIYFNFTHLWLYMTYTDSLFVVCSFFFSLYLSLGSKIHRRKLWINSNWNNSNNEQRFSIKVFCVDGPQKLYILTTSGINPFNLDMGYEMKLLAFCYHQNNFLVFVIWNIAFHWVYF